MMYQVEDVNMLQLRLMLSNNPVGLETACLEEDGTTSRNMEAVVGGGAEAKRPQRIQLINMVNLFSKGAKLMSICRRARIGTISFATSFGLTETPASRTCCLGP